MKNAIVTGGTGVTGNALVRYLLERDISVTAVVRPGSSRRKNLPDDARLTVAACDLADLPSLQTALPGGQDVFFHLGWDGSRGSEKTDNRNNMPLQAKNIVFAAEAAELAAALGCKAFLFTGTQAEYGPQTGPVSELTPKSPANGYGIAKSCAAAMTRLFCERHNIAHIHAELFSVYGPCDGTESMVDTTVKKLSKGETPRYTKGEQMWDYLYSADAAKALFLLAEQNKSGRWCVANGETQPLRRYIQTIHAVFGAPPPVFGEIAYAAGQPMYLGADISKLRRDTGFAPDYSFEDGMREMIKIKGGGRR